MPASQRPQEQDQSPNVLFLEYCLVGRHGTFDRRTAFGDRPVIEPVARHRHAAQSAQIARRRIERLAALAVAGDLLTGTRFGALWIAHEVILLGLLFLAGQAFEWTSLFSEGVDYSSTYGSPFFTVTGIHGTHVFVGILWAIYLLFGNRRMLFTKENHLAIENFGLYWHFVDIVWIVLFTVIYLI